MMPVFRLLSVALALACGLCSPAHADIFSFTAADGSVSLSNVPADDRYTLLIAAPPGPTQLPLAPLVTAVPAARRNGASALRSDPYAGFIEAAARAHGVEGALLHAVVSVESSYNARAVSKKGAIGLMQLMPQTAKRYGVVDAFDPQQNLDGGAHYLRDLLRRFDNDLQLALAAYNAGEAAVTRHGHRIPPFDETRRYVPLVLDYYRRYQARTGPV